MGIVYLMLVVGDVYLCIVGCFLIVIGKVIGYD